jgi:mono/diheme cytochrome c family protein
LLPVHATSLAHLSGVPAGGSASDSVDTTLEGAERQRYVEGKEIYSRDGYCGTCHQPDGKGLPAAGFPPLAGSEWVTGNPERLIKLTLKGLLGPFEVNGESYPGNVPMTPFEGLLDDEEMAAVLTYVRNAFGNTAAAIAPEQVASVRTSVEGRDTFYRAEELQRQ